MLFRIRLVKYSHKERYVGPGLEVWESQFVWTADSQIHLHFARHIPDFGLIHAQIGVHHV